MGLMTSLRSSSSCSNWSMAFFVSQLVCYTLYSSIVIDQSLHPSTTTEDTAQLGELLPLAYFACLSP